MEDKYLVAPEPPGDCAGRAAAGECNPGRLIVEPMEGEGLDSGRWYELLPPLPTLEGPLPEPAGPTPPPSPAAPDTGPLPVEPPAFPYPKDGLPALLREAEP